MTNELAFSRDEVDAIRLASTLTLLRADHIDLMLKLAPAQTLELSRRLACRSNAKEPRYSCLTTTSISRPVTYVNICSELSISTAAYSFQILTHTIQSIARFRLRPVGPHGHLVLSSHPVHTSRSLSILLNRPCFSPGAEMAVPLR